MRTRTFGVEEELLLINAADGTPAAVGARVVREAGARRRDGGTDPKLPPIDHEFKAEQVEISSTATTSAETLERDLRALRAELAAAAAGAGVQLSTTAARHGPGP